MKKILITGARGMLATDYRALYNTQYELLSYDREQLDITRLDTVREVLTQERPDIVLNCAAYTNVDESERVGKKSVFDINSLGVYHLAQVTHELSIDLITISTDYVFDGSNSDGYKEYDECHPINTYGMSKYLWEQLAQTENPETIIVRTSWLYGGGKDFKNFVNTMITLALTRSELKVVNDQHGIPTYTRDLSRALTDIIEDIDTYRGRILHLSNTAETWSITWYEFAQEIFHQTHTDISVIPCTSQEFVSLAVRPQYSKLINESDIVLGNWKDWLREYLSTLKS